MLCTNLSGDMVVPAYGPGLVFAVRFFVAVTGKWKKSLGSGGLRIVEPKVEASIEPEQAIQKATVLSILVVVLISHSRI